MPAGVRGTFRGSNMAASMTDIERALIDELRINGVEDDWFEQGSGHPRLRGFFRGRPFVNVFLGSIRGTAAEISGMQCGGAACNLLGLRSNLANL
jgi:hypothetical protein